METNIFSPQIISVSRRTDIPAFYSDWFMNRIKAGYVQYRNPFGGQTYEVSLKPEAVTALVFWSRNYKPLLRYLDTLTQWGYRFYFHFTINGYPRDLENRVPPLEKAVDMLKTLADKYSPGHVQWRFDPIVLSNKTPADYILDLYGRIAKELQGATQRCYFSFVDFYRKTDRNLSKLGSRDYHFRDPSREEKKDLTRQLVKVAEEFHMGLYACCEDFLLEIPGVQKAHCVDAELIGTLFPEKFHRPVPNKTREECGCFASRDIGAYDTCPHGCLYCYANADPEKSKERHKRHDPENQFLGSF